MKKKKDGRLSEEEWHEHVIDDQRKNKTALGSVCDSLQLLIMYLERLSGGWPSE